MLTTSYCLTPDETQDLLKFFRVLKVLTLVHILAWFWSISCLVRKDLGKYVRAKHQDQTYHDIFPNKFSNIGCYVFLRGTRVSPRYVVNMEYLSSNQYILLYIFLILSYIWSFIIEFGYLVSSMFEETKDVGQGQTVHRWHLPK